MELAILMASVAGLAAFFVVGGAFIRQVDKAEAAQKARKQAQRKQRELLLLAGVMVVIEENEAALVQRLRQTRYMDPYGRWVTDKWAKELRYFFETVLLPEFPVEDLSVEERPGLFEALARWAYTVNVDDCADLPDGEAAPADGLGYERFVGSALTKAGFNIHFTPTSGDQGVDLIAEQGARRIAIQCKNYLAPVGNEAVQQVYAGAKFYGAREALVVAPNGFTRAARQLAGALNVRCIHHTELAAIGALDLAPMHVMTGRHAQRGI